MRVLTRDTRNILFQTSALTIMASNMASGFDDIDMIDDSIINSIIFNNSDENNKVRGQSIMYSAPSSRSSSSSSDKSVEEYVVRVQRENNSMYQDNPVVPTDSL